MHVEGHQRIGTYGDLTGTMAGANDGTYMNMVAIYSQQTAQVNYAQSDPIGFK
jgi:hypothetical protein